MNPTPQSGILAALVAAAPDGLLVVSSDGAIRAANSAAARMFGYEPADLIGRPCRMLVPEPSRDRHDAHREAWFAAPAPRDSAGAFARTGRRKDGSPVRLDIALRALPDGDGLPLAACWIRETPPSTPAEAQLRALHGVARAVAAAAGLDEAARPALEALGRELGWEAGLLWSTLSTSGTTLRVRSGWTSGAGPLEDFVTWCRGREFSPEEGVIGVAWSRRQPTWISDLASEPSFVRRDIAAPADLRSMAVVPLIFGGRLLGALELFSTRHRPPEPETLVLLGSLGALLGEFVDRVRSQEALEERAAQLRQSEKLEAIGRLAGGVAHDFNNMLTAILGFSEDLLKRLPSDSPLRSEVGHIRRAGERSASLTRQLLAFGRRQMLQPRVLDPNAAIRDLEPMLRRLIGDAAELQVSPAADLGCVKVDPGQLDQVVLNLALNARDAMPSGGRLLIETANAELDENYARRHPGVSPGAYVMLAVSDTGVGMDEEMRKRIFEPFFTTKGGRGTGLGLATIHGVVNQSGGHIWVYSEPGRGTTFKIYLPRVLARPEADTPPPPARTQGTETILVVEDEDLVRGIVETTLRSAGYTVLSAGTPEEALAAATKHAGAIALVLSDVVLPGGKLHELRDRLTQLLPAAKRLYMSGYTENVIFHDGVLDKGVEFIEKPFVPQALLERVRRLLDRKA